MSVQTTAKKPGKKPFGRDGPPKGYPKDQTLYADPENWRYPLHTSWHARAARRYFDDSSNRSKYSEEERAYIDQRIDNALKGFGLSQSTVKRRPQPKIPSRKNVDELSLEDLLKLFLGSARFQRAKEMDDALVSITGGTADTVSGKVKDYVVRIDLQKHTILHDCEDWRKNMDSKNMCKHLGKFLLRLDEREATTLLREVLKNKDLWQFAAP